jgi:hypothetical protein
MEIALVGVDGFHEDEAESKGNNGAIVLGRLLAAECHALEALQLANKLFDAGAGSIERSGEERRSVPGWCLERDVRSKVKQDLELRAVTGLTLCELEGERPPIQVNLEVDLGWETAPRAAQCLTSLPPLAPAAETCARTMVESNIRTKWAVWLVAVSASKKASNTPAWLSRQKRFQMEFQLPNSAGSARHVMLWMQK